MTGPRAPHSLRHEPQITPPKFEEPPSGTPPCWMSVRLEGVALACAGVSPVSPLRTRWLDSPSSLAGAMTHASVPVVSEAVHGTSACWHSGCRGPLCRRAHSDTQRAWGRARAQARLSVELRQQLLDAIYAGQPLRTVLGDLGLSSNKVFGLARTDQEWSEKLDAALMASRRDGLEHGTNAAYLHGCVCSDCRAHQQVRQGRTVAR
jgi:hypothetical protein